MRITHETLLKIANDAVARQARASRQLLAAYLCGSLLGEAYLLGGTTDIDLVFIYIEAPDNEREITPLTDEVHLDIAHHGQQEYREPRRLRVHPWLGPALNTCRVLYDPQHFMDFIQASVRGQFDRPDYVFERARRQMEQARSIWLDLRELREEPSPDRVELYLRSLEYSANSIACLSGPPLTERRFLQVFPERAEAVGRAGLYAGLLGLLGAPRLANGNLREWLSAWQAAYRSLPTELATARLHPDRLMYYLRAFQALMESEQPIAALWPLLRTWTLAAKLLPTDSQHRRAWQASLDTLGLSGEGFAERLRALDVYLDMVDETLESWARENGVWEV